MSFATIVFQRNALVVLGHVAQRPVGRGAHRGRGPPLVSPSGSWPDDRSPRSRAVRVESRSSTRGVRNLATPPMPGRAPRPALVPRAHEHQEQPDRVGAVARDQLVRVLDVAPGLAHPLAVGAQDLALVEQLAERLALGRPGPRSRIALVKNRLYSRCITACSAPPVYWSTGDHVADHLGVDRPVRLVRRQVAEPVPGRVDERVQRVGLALRRAAALRARDVEERLVAVERVLAAAPVVDARRAAGPAGPTRAPGPAPSVGQWMTGIGVPQ